MEEKEVLAKAADTITQEPVTVTIDILKRQWLARMLKAKVDKANRNLQPTDIAQQLTGFRKWLYYRFCVRVFEIKQAPLNTLIKLSKELIDIDLKVFDPNNFLQSNYELMDTHGARMARIAAIAVSNPRDQPKDDHVNFFLDNLTSKELYHMASIVIQQMDIINFMNTIASIKGVNVLQQRTASATSASRQEASQ